MCHRNVHFQSFRFITNHFHSLLPIGSLYSSKFYILLPSIFYQFIIQSAVLLKNVTKYCYKIWLQNFCLKYLNHQVIAISKIFAIENYTFPSDLTKKNGVNQSSKFDHYLKGIMKKLFEIIIHYLKKLFEY